MINDIEYFNYYFRYLWTVGDFDKLQTALSDTTRGSMKGAYNGSCLNGLECDRSASRTVRVKPGIAISPSGKLMYHEVEASFAFTAPVNFPERAYLVIRPKLVQNNPITSPTDPNTQVFLNVKQTYEIVMLRGTPSVTPVYPAKGADDVVLCGVFLSNVSILDGNNDINYDVRDIPNRNTNQTDSHGITDDRLRPYKASYKTIGIKPAFQGELANLGVEPSRSKPLGFSYILAGKPSRFPRDAFNVAQNVDVIIDFQSGSVTGGLTASFTPYVPEAGKYQLALITIGKNDNLKVKFPSIYSYVAKSGAMADIYSGVAAADDEYKAIAFVVLYSLDGTTVADLTLYDARHPGNVTAVKTPAMKNINANVTPSVTVLEGDNLTTFIVDTSIAAAQFVMPPPATGFKFTFVDGAGFFGQRPIKFVRNASEKIQGLSVDFIFEAVWGSISIVSDGIDWYVI